VNQSDCPTKEHAITEDLIMAKLITGIFKTRSSATLAAEDLVRHGFAQDDISSLMSETARGREFFVEEHTKSPEGLATGAAIGGIVGAIAAGLTSIGMIAMPGAAFYPVGQGLAALTGFGAGSLVGGIIGGLVGLAIPEHVAAFHRHAHNRGGILVGVHAPRGRALEAKKVLDAAGADSIHVENVRDRGLRGRDEDIHGDRPIDRGVYGT
jgi:hypothetical protein